ncbi:unnamed protein product [Calypogeia fissa]
MGSVTFAEIRLCHRQSFFSAGNSSPRQNCSTRDLFKSGSVGFNSNRQLWFPSGTLSSSSRGSRGPWKVVMVDRLSQASSRNGARIGGGERENTEGKVRGSKRNVSQSGGDSSTADSSGFIRSKLAVFLSGRGSNFRALHSAALNNSIYGDMTVVISDKPSCKGCDYAREHGLEVLTYPRSKHAEDGLSVEDLVEALRDRGIDYVLLAGYLKLLPPELVHAFPRSILNIHPSLLPSFGGKGYYGMKVHEAVIKSGARFSGATIHFVDEKFDTGPIVAQRIVPVLSDDTPQDLAAKVLTVEQLLYSEVVAALCEDRIFWRDDGVPLIRKSWVEAEYY